MQQTVEEIAALLHIHKEASSHGGPLKNIADAAYGRLVQLNKEMEQDTWLDGTPLPKDPATAPAPADEPAPYEEPPVEEPAPVPVPDEPTPEAATAPERKF